MTMRPATLGVVLAASISLFGCDGGGGAAPAVETPAAAAPATNRIDVPPAVRENLGITFAKVERRPVRETLRVPGRFELRPEATREYHAMVAGRAELLVDQFQRVTPGTPLVRLDSPSWRQTQHQAVEAEGEIKLAEAALRVAEASLTEAEGAAAFVRSRLDRLGELSVRQVELEGQLAEREAQLPKLRAELRARQTELDEAREHYASILNVLASLSGVPRERLLETVGAGGEAEPYWRTLDILEFRAEREGIVSDLAVTNGGWVEPGGLLVTTLDPTRLRFHAEAPQSDLARLRDGMPARIAPPQGGSLAFDDAVDATVRVGYQAHPQDRTVPLYATPERVPTWAKPGVSAYLEVFTGGAETPELAIPTSSLVRDDLRLIFYRRDPRDPDQVYPVDADLGPSDGRWTVVYSGVTDGDEVVLDGAYALRLAGGRQQAPPGYHYHADGTLHQDH